jgi:hypothetical protein
MIIHVMHSIKDHNSVLFTQRFRSSVFCYCCGFDSGFHLSSRKENKAFQSLIPTLRYHYNLVLFSNPVGCGGSEIVRAFFTSASQICICYANDAKSPLWRSTRIFLCNRVAFYAI